MVFGSLVSALTITRFTSGRQMAQAAYANSTVLDRLLIQPRLYETFDVQFGPMGPLEFLRVRQFPPTQCQTLWV